MKIMLLDDSVKHRRAGLKQLEALGHEVVAFCDYVEARNAAKEGGFDAALIDLLMPAEGMMLGTEAIGKFVGTEMAVGFPMAMELASFGIKKIGVITDTNHHAHPMSAMVDWFHGKVIKIDGADVIIDHADLVEGGAKNWGNMLQRLLAS